ncbi:protease complex subunit PrcB family protein [Herpetosiphon llansteffanensis]|uniref:protease complex subunit PrcB family protein n=1 Tax=Herpetosiphon llansteffanensis TaxID=2094568 RepID=UPI000F51A763|nr:protease complex subunit PrcB family protein [Herpetosiphon llansteffanensis]
MRRLIWLILMGIMSGILTGCSTAPAIGSAVPVTPLARLDDRYNGVPLYQLEETELGLMIAGMPNEHKALLAVTPRAWQPIVADVDLKKTLLIGVFTGEKQSGGYQVAIKAVGYVDATLTIQVHYTIPDPNEYSQPFIPTTSLEIFGIDRMSLPMATLLGVRVIDQTDTELAHQTYQLP